MLDFPEIPASNVRDLSKLLKEWKLENILSHLTAQEVDVEILEMMKLSHIRLLLHGFPVGIQIRFEYNLEQWRSDIGKPLQSQTIDDRQQLSVRDQQDNIQKTTNDIRKSKLLGISKTVQTEFYHTQANNKINNPVLTPTHQASNRSTPLNSASLTQTAKSQHSVNLQEILLHNQPDESEIIDDYHVNKKFSHAERQRLINTIVNYYLENYIDFNLQTSYDLENAILEMFPNERLDMYRNTKHGKLYLRYNAARSVFYTKQKRLKTDERQDVSQELCHADANGNSLTGSFSEDSLRTEVASVSNNYHQNKLRNNDDAERDDVRETYNTEIDDKAELILPVADVKSTLEGETEILLQTVHNGCKKFVKIFKPFSYHDFMSTACTTFYIPSVDDCYATVNDCEISENDFKNVILQYYKLPTFAVVLKQNAVDITPIQLTKVEHLENSCSPSNTFDQQQNPYMNTSMDNGSVQIIYNHLPDANDIRNIPSLLPMVKIADSGKPLENKHRTSIAKAIIDECLNFQPERVLKRQDFLTLSQNLVHAFPNEVASAYFIPSQTNHAARGKLWNAYNNKRNFYGSSGIVQRRHHNIKRKHLSDQDDKNEQTSDKVYVSSEADVEFSQDSPLDWNILKEKWSNSHRKRRDELVRHKMSVQDYMHKYSILRGVQGIDLMEADVNILYPTVTNVSNWLSLYDKVVDKARKMRKFEMVTKIIAAIDSSNDERYRASLALLLISYIFPYNAKLNDNGDRASKSEIQERFIKEYKSMDDLESDIPCADLKIRFVHQSDKIIYAEFSIGGFLFKCVDLLEALSSIFHYIMAMNVEYPKMCWHIWQFVQLAIFQIEIQDYILPNVESTINDLFMTH